MDSAERLQNIYKQVHELKNSERRLMKDNEALKTENQGLKAEIDELKNRVQELEQKNINLQIAKVISHKDVNHKVIKTQIDKYVKDIDQCLEFLKMR